jgi:hypothetical protein
MTTPTYRREQRERDATRTAQLAQMRTFLDGLPAPDQYGHVIPLVARLVQEVHDDTAMRVLVNSRWMKAWMGSRAIAAVYGIRPHA